MTYTEFREKYNIRLNHQQEKAVQTVDGAALVLAVPGSGKTTVLVTRLGYMIQGCGIAPDSILTMTYTRAAAADMKGRYIEMFGNEGRIPEFRTINGVSYMIIRLYEQATGRKAYDVVGDEKKIGFIIRDVFRKALNDYPTDSDIKDIRSSIAYAKNMMMSQDEIDDYEWGTDKFPEILKEYNAYLRDNRLMDYDDQMIYAYTILRNYPEILERIQNKLKYICVDEAQDTSKIQHVIIKMLASEYNNIFMVGDEDQSIYGFRAAFPQALTSFEKIYPDAKVLLMEENFRSTKNIVAVADRFIQDNRNRYRKNMKTRNDAGCGVFVIPLKSAFAQYEYLKKVARECAEETAILFRNNESALPLIKIFEKDGIPYSYRQSDAVFFSNRVVLDILSVIKLALNPADTELFMQIYYKLNSCLKLSRNSAEEICRQCNDTGRDIVGVIVSDRQFYRGDSTPVFAKIMRSVKTTPPEITIDRIVSELGYGEFMRNNHLSMQKVAILKALAAGEKTPESFINSLGILEDTVRNREKNDSLITLSTIHSAKGLEFDRVYIIDVTDGVLPQTDKNEDSDAYEEERRLFYVAMTRAKKSLNIFDLSAVMPSSFAAEISKAANPERESDKQDKTAKKQKKQLKKPEVYDSFRHTKYGAGVVIAVDGDIFTVSFDDGPVKKFSWKAIQNQ